MNQIIIPILCSLGGALLLWIGQAARSAIKKRADASYRVRVTSPEAEVLEKVVPALNAVLAVQRPTLDIVIALGEKGLGVEDIRVAEARGARQVFQDFLDRSAKIGAPCA
jgi:hypothetical protein